MAWEDFMQELVEQFVKEKRFLKNVTSKTVRFYYQSLKTFNHAARCLTPSELNKTVLNECVVKMRESGLSPISCNTYISGINSFLTWLYENEYTKEHFKIKELRAERKVLQTFKDEHIRAILTYKPRGFYEWRLYALLCVLIDTGVRIEEALTLTRSKVDFDNLLLTVKGKGNKDRTVPMSLELRKVLYRWSNKHPHQLMFPTRQGARLGYHNVLRDFKNLATRLGIEGVRVSPHTLRHTFAKSYVKSGGNLFYLMKALGHTTLAMSKRYVELDSEDLKEMHTKVSIMNRLR
jgi:integrase/recombinase XerD